MTSSTTTLTLTEPQRAQITDIILQVRDGQPGQCGFIAEVLAEQFGWPSYAGFYHSLDGRTIGDHVWNVHADGTIIDATADQFGEGHSVRVIAPDDPEHGRYQYGADEHDDHARQREAARNRTQYGDCWWVTGPKTRRDTTPNPRSQS